ncbi:XRE family transcriptional regulator [Patulibacter sp. NPDC049589]|uniref:XRE family transcriptional regulator n=1 Tax=Patulibacter sp. NPDC049589 TaxID=3154731 RepID=UPI003412B52A
MSSEIEPASGAAGGPGEDDGAVGRRLRELRRARGLSARAVAERAQVSPAYLSRLENGKVSPTVSTLTRVVQAMDESVASLFDAASVGPVVRRADRRAVRHRGVVDTFVTPPGATRLEILETTIDPGADSGRGSYAHPGDEECILLLEGELEVWVDGLAHRLEEGDAITYACRLPHRWKNHGAVPARALWIVTPARY